MASTVRLRFFEGPLQALLTGPSGPVAQEIAKRGEFVASTARTLAPVDTGRLRSSITTEMSRDFRGVVCYVGSNTEYAIYQELGTSRMPAHPFLVPALGRLPR